MKRKEIYNLREISVEEVQEKLRAKVEKYFAKHVSKRYLCAYWDDCIRTEYRTKLSAEEAKKKAYSFIDKVVFFYKSKAADLVIVRIEKGAFYINIKRSLPHWSNPHVAAIGLLTI